MTRSAIRGVAVIAATACAACSYGGIRQADETLMFADSLLVRGVVAREEQGKHTITVCAARGEYESFLLVVDGQAGGNILHPLFSKLTGPDEIPVDAINCRLVASTACRMPKDPRLARKRKFDGRAELVERIFPDRLIPVQETHRAEGRRVYWVTIKVPAEAKPGTYRGVAQLGEEGKVKGAFRLKVWNFSLPKTMALQMSVGLPRGIDTARDPSVLKRWCLDFAAHRVSVRGVRDPPITFREGKAVVDWSAFDREMEFLIDELGMGNLQFPFSYVVWGHGKRYVQTFGNLSRGTVSAEFRQNYAAAIREAAAHLKEKGWLEKFVANFSDEPYEDQYEETRTLAGLIRQAVPELKPAAFGPFPCKDLIGSIRHWITLAYPLDPRWADGLGRNLGTRKVAEINELLNAEIRRGNLWSVYNPGEDYALAAEPIEQRTFYWWCFGKGIWSVFQWTACDPRSQLSLSGDWDSTWVYIEDGDIIGTIRWEMTRDGIEDAEYLHLLKAMKGHREAEGFCLQMARSITDRESDPLKLIELRRQIGELLDAGTRSGG